MDEALRVLERQLSGPAGKLVRDLIAGGGAGPLTPAQLRIFLVAALLNAADRAAILRYLVAAARLGLITRMVPAENLRDEAIKLAARIAAMSPLALKRTRDLLYQMEDMSFEEVPNAALDAVSSAFDSEDSREARKAFLEKRKPIWTGR